MNQQRDPQTSRYPEPVRAYAAMNTVRALERLAFMPMSTPALADSLQVSVRTARRLLQRLALEGFVTQERGHRRRYHGTLRLAALGIQMLGHSPLVCAAAPCVSRLARDTSCAAHLWIAGYGNEIVCVVHADERTAAATVSPLCDVGSSCLGAAGNLLFPARSELASSSYVPQAEEATFAAAVVERGQVVAALGLSGDRAHEAIAAVVTAAAQVSADLRSRP